MLEKLVFGMSKIDGEGSKLGSAGNAGEIPRETRSEMKEQVGDVGTSTRRRNRTLESGWDRHYLPRWRDHTLECDSIGLKYRALIDIDTAIC